ncbi:MAG: sigma-70 family RNA polymerase sigma factor [Pseudomonadota bacterium]
MSRAPSAEFELLVRDHAALVARIASTYESRPALVEELAQEIFLSIYRALPSFRGDAAVRTFVARIANNVSVDHVRREARTPREVDVSLASDVPDPDGDQELSTDMALKRARLLQAVRTLDLSLRQVISLHLEGFSNVEIGETLSLTPNNVGVRLHRARSELEKRLVQSSAKVAP